MAALALALAAVTWRWIEQPVRQRRVAAFATTRRALAGGAAILVACTVPSSALWAWGSRPAPAGSILAQYLAARGGAIRDFPFCDNEGRGRRCETGAATGAPAILLWGDSHAAHLTEGLDRAARAAGFRIVARTMGGCSPGGSPDAVRAREAFWADCVAFNGAMLASIPLLQREYDVRGVVVAGEWTEQRTGWDRQLELQVNALRHSGLRVVLVRDGPVFRPDFITCARRRGAGACALPRADVERRAAVTEAALTRVAAGKPDVQIWSPLDTLCPEQRCPALIGGRLLYRNLNHLAIEGSALLAPAMAPMLAWIADAPSKR